MLLEMGILKIPLIIIMLYFRPRGIHITTNKQKQFLFSHCWFLQNQFQRLSKPNVLYHLALRPPSREAQSAVIGHLSTPTSVAIGQTLNSESRLCKYTTETYLNSVQWNRLCDTAPRRKNSRCRAKVVVHRPGSDMLANICRPRFWVSSQYYRFS